MWRVISSCSSHDEECSRIFDFDEGFCIPLLKLLCGIPPLSILLRMSQISDSSDEGNINENDKKSL